MNTLYIIIPAYNEEANIETVVKEWYEVIKERSEESRLVVIDDGSKDSTYAIMQKLAETMPKFVPLTKPNGGHGATVLFQTDSDGQTRPEEFPQFWEKREQYHMVIGHRKGRQDGLSRVFVTKTLKLVCLLCFHVRVKDANTPFRIMQAEYLEKNLKVIPENYNLPNVVLSVLYAKKKEPVLYIPITFRPRQGGVNSINMKKIFKIGKQAWKDFREINRCIKRSMKEEKENTTDEG